LKGGEDNGRNGKEEDILGNVGIDAGAVRVTGTIVPQEWIDIASGEGQIELKLKSFDGRPFLG
jgi:hypothetical protein